MSRQPAQLLPPATSGILRGFDPQEIEVMALITRYHRRATPKKEHPGYGDLPKRLRTAVKVLASCLRLAEGLDRSHAQVIESVRLYDRGEDFLLQMKTAGDAELEVWAANRHTAAFEEMVGKPVRFEVAQSTAKRKSRPVQLAAS